MKKAILLAVVSCFLFSSVGFAFEGMNTNTSKKSSYSEMLKKKSKKKAKKAPAAS
jgi:hypothetical protein